MAMAKYRQLLKVLLQELQVSITDIPPPLLQVLYSEVWFRSMGYIQVRPCLKGYFVIESEHTHIAGQRCKLYGINFIRYNECPDYGDAMLRVDIKCPVPIRLTEQVQTIDMFLLLTILKTENK